MNKILVFLFCVLMFLMQACIVVENELIKVLVYYNPSGTFFSDSQHLQVATPNQVIIDTVFKKNTHIDKSRLIKCLKISENDLKHLSIKVNNIDTILQHSEKIKKCMAVFISYSDHEGLFNEINKRGLDVTDNVDGFNKTLDSLKNVLGKKLCKIKVNIKHDYCECD
ncbi:hypothetical protein [Sphingobacterium endophyticum]|uniref:hypothetical protein n=1 Tax=Sphingobacterium endophyticum TaxID=2546448 RepID=UPI0012E2AEF0|nr:hypothetical protein [Sphingobacterium endophyticum]